MEHNLVSIYVYFIALCSDSLSSQYFFNDISYFTAIHEIEDDAEAHRISSFRILNIIRKGF
jgi:hypothetical protein